MRIQDPNIRRLNIRSDYGGLGDQIARLPAFAKVVRENKEMFVSIYMQDFAVEVCDAALKQKIGDLNNWQVIPMSLYSKARTVINTFEQNFQGVNINSLRMHLTQHAHLIVNNEVVTAKEHLEYLCLGVDRSKRAAAEPYVVVTTGFTAPARELPVSVINEIIAGLIRLNLVPVLLGSNQAVTGESTDINASFSENITTEGCVDLRGKTTLMECYQYLANAECVLGLDNGVLHLSSMSDVPVIWAFTTVRPEHRVPWRRSGDNYVIQPSSTCRYCQSDNMYLLTDFRKCIFKTYDCTKSLTSKNFLDIVEAIQNFNEISKTNFKAKSKKKS